MPDNQECFTHSVSDQSIIFDILEYPEGVEDSQAAEYHLKDLVEDDVRITENKQIKSQFPEYILLLLALNISILNSILNDVESCDTVCLLTAQHSISKYKETAKNLVNLHLALFRLNKYKTDILVTFNDTISIQ